MDEPINLVLFSGTDDRLQAAARAHQEWLPGRLTDPGDLLRVYRSFTVGG